MRLTDDVPGITNRNQIYTVENNVRANRHLRRYSVQYVYQYHYDTYLATTLRWEFLNSCSPSTHWLKISVKSWFSFWKTMNITVSKRMDSIYSHFYLVSFSQYSIANWLSLYCPAYRSLWLMVRFQAQWWIPCALEACSASFCEDDALPL